MGCASFSRCKQARLCAVAHAGKASGDFGKAQGHVTFDIFAEHPFGSGLVNDAGDVWPQVPRVVFAEPLSGRTERLTGIARKDDIHASTPACAVKGAQIVPNRGFAQRRVLHPRHEGGRRMGFPLDISHSPISGLCDVQPKVEAAISCAKGNAPQSGMLGV